MRDIDRLKELKTSYLRLIRLYGKQVAEFDTFRKSLLELNREHRLAAMKMYADMIREEDKGKEIAPEAGGYALLLARIKGSQPELSPHGKEREHGIR